MLLFYIEMYLHLQITDKLSDSLISVSWIPTLGPVELLRYSIRKRKIQLHQKVGKFWLELERAHVQSLSSPDGLFVVEYYALA